MTYYGRLKKIEFELPLNLEPGEIAWVRWDHYRHGDSPPTATPTRVLKVYDDGNILHERRGYDDTEFAFSRDIIAKSADIPFDRMPYRTIKISEINDALYLRSVEERKKAEAEVEEEVNA